ncbi:hypothetical protein OIE66_36380 [Nonomuraea sp. NBC_01738]|uniref:hypothetical protein n=1 Tax=Nonomuraea sp. NBC_01738 TaxID=2976003 RepID=UPI002E143F8B|nr:hypothetical protein OIE66_36380 [Nonomuraea sp. NBC_01738]
MTTLAHTPASAAPADLNVEYRCTPTGSSSVVRNGAHEVRLKTSLTFATDLFVGDPLNFTWKLAYVNGYSFQSPNYFAANSNLHVEGNVELKSSWVGILKPKGSADQTGKLSPDDYLTMPEAITDPGLMDKAGTIEVIPRDIVVDFTPPDGFAVANDGNEPDNPIDLQVAYTGPWASMDDRATSEGHHHNDLHTTSQMGAEAKLSFVGTGVEFIGPRDKDGGTADVYVDGVKTKTVDYARDDNNQQVNDNLRGGASLFKSPPLDYGPHTIIVKNASTKPVWVDAFKVSTNTAKVPTGYHGAICKPMSQVSLTVTVKPKGGQTSPPPTGTSPTPTIPTGTPTVTPTSTPTNTGPHHHNPGPTDRGLVSVVPGTVSTATTSTRASAGPTATRYVKAQVQKTPKGGVETGQAPDPGRQPYGLVAGGAVLLMGSAAGGLLVRRRRAAHAGGAK